MNAFLLNFVSLLGWNLKKTIYTKNVRVLFEKICIFHSNSSVPPNNINVFVFMFQDNDEDVV